MKKIKTKSTKTKYSLDGLYTSEDGSKHYVLGASSSEIWFNCTGYVELTLKHGLPPAGEHALKGTRGHTACLMHKVKPEVEYLNKGTKVPEMPTKMASEWKHYAEEFWDKIFEEVLEGSITGKKVYVEFLLTLWKGVGGTADLIVLCSDDKGNRFAIVLDLKTGRVRVEPKAEQLKLYATALWHGVKEKLGYELAYVMSYVYQPTHEEALTKHKFTKASLQTARGRYIKRAKEVRRGVYKYKYGDHCEWCPHKLRCATHRKGLKEEIGADIVVIGKKAKNKELPQIKNLNPEQISKLARIEKVIVSYFKEVKKFIFSEIIRGNKYPGWKVVRANGKRKWLDDEEFIVKTLKRLKIDPYKTQKSLRSITSIQRESGKDVLGQLTDKPLGQMILVPESDKRPAIQSHTDLLDEYDD